jgi:type I restriction enzyme M protein
MKFGTMLSRKQKELTDSDVAKLSDTYHNWRGKEWQKKYKDIAGFCKSANIQEVRKNNYILTPGRYIDFIKDEDDGVLFDEKMSRLTITLREQMQQTKVLDATIRKNLKRIGYEL